MLAASLRVSRLARAVGLAMIPFATTQHALAQEASGADPKVTTLKEVKVSGQLPPETEAKETYQAVTTRIGKGKQALRDIPQSVTVVTERLIDDRNLDTLKDVLHQTSGVTFLAAEGGEEDIRLRGYSLQGTGDILVDGMRDPAIYERDTFNYDRVEVLRGSASMLFGRGSTGGVVNQVSKIPYLLDRRELTTTIGTGNYGRAETDLNFVTGAASAARITAMKTAADNNGAGSAINKEGAAGSYRWGIGETNEYLVSLYYLKNRNGINYGLPWLPRSATNSGNTLIDKDPSAYYGLDSDRANSDAVNGTVTQTHRLAGGGEIKTAFRAAKVKRDQRASTIRFAAASAQPNRLAVNGDTISDATVLTRNTQYKIQELDNQVLQSDYTDRFSWFGLRHDITTGIDFNHEFRTTYGLVSPASLTKPNTTVGDDDGGPAIDESLRSVRRSAEFDVYSGGAYFQDLAQVAEHWKLLGGIRFDYVDGDYRTYNTADPTQGSISASRGRNDKLWSKRFGVLYQPSSTASWHFSYGTSFNTAGDTYQYDAKGSNTPPEKSRNVEAGGKLDLFDGNMTSRFAIFHSTKYNERNNDPDEITANDNSYLLSAQRYSKGFETDLAGRLAHDWEIYVSYTWIPVAKIKRGASTLANEGVGTRPGLIPKHQGTIWTTYSPRGDTRLGLGLNGRSKMYPQQVNTFQVDGYVTVDAMVEYDVSRDLTLKLNGSNLTNQLYADSVYRAHYVPGKGRVFQLTANYKF